MSRVRQFLTSKAINTRIEIGAYEHLWLQPCTTTKTIGQLPW